MAKSVSSHCWWQPETRLASEKSFPDFVLISEFSELEGPVPLTIVANSSFIDFKPSASADQLRSLHLHDFDFNAFVLRIMSTDRSSSQEQAQSVGDDMVPSTGPMFSIPDDTQVYFSDVEHEFYTFTYHLTLFDINARGYVHPIALSFVTRDPDKIIVRFDHFVEKFGHVSRLMKKGNFLNFTLDLKCRLLDLEHTQTERALCHDRANSVPDEALQQAITVTKLILDTMEASASQWLGSGAGCGDGESDIPSSIITATSHTDSLEIAEPPKDYKPNFIDTLYPVPHFERKLRSLAQLCQEPSLEKGNRGQRRRSLLHASVIPLVSTIEPRSSMTKDRNRYSLANDMARDKYTEATKYLSDVIKDLGRSSVILDIDDEEEFYMEPLSDAITIGRTFILNLENPHPKMFMYASPDSRSSVETMSSVLLESGGGNPKKVESVPAETSSRVPLLPMQRIPSRLWYDQSDTVSVILSRFQPVIQHVLYSMLTGRPVVVVGDVKKRSLVESTVEALSHFVPGQTKRNHRIVPWLTNTMVTDEALASIKLVGTFKTNVDPSVYRLEISYLDVDKDGGDLVTSPLYLDGVWIQQMLEKIPLFSTTGGVLAHIHAMFLAMALKAYVYHHMHLAEYQPMPDEASTEQGYASESSTSSTGIEGASKKWGMRRMMSYLRWIEERENKEASELPDNHGLVETMDDTGESTSTEMMACHAVTDSAPQPKEPHQTTEQDDLESNEATVRPRSIPIRSSVISLHWNIPSPSSPQSQNDTSLSSSIVSLPFYLGVDISDENDNDDQYCQDDGHGADDHSSMHPQQSREDRQTADGLTDRERRGRYFLHDKYNVRGDDQTIVVYLASLTPWKSQQAGTSQG